MTDLNEVDRLVEVITVDCYNLAEQVTAFYETFTEEVGFPTTATVVGTTIHVVGIDVAEYGGLAPGSWTRGWITPLTGA